MTRDARALRGFVVVTVVAAALSSIAYWAYQTRRGDWTWAWQEESIGRIAPDSGSAFVAETGRSELSGEQRVSPAAMLENGVYQKPGNVSRAQVREAGRGAFLFWSDRVYFSSSDNTDPRTNGRRYSFVYPPVARRTAWLSYLSAIAADAAALLFAAVLWLRGTLQQGSRQLAEKVIELRRIVAALKRPERGPGLRGGLAIWFLLVLPAVLVTLHALAIAPLRAEILPIVRPTHLSGFAYVAELSPQSLIAPHETAEQVLEDGVAVPFPPLAGYGSVIASGGGRYCAVGNTLFFSALDNTDVPTNGRRYSVRRPATVPNAVIVAVWLLAILATLSLAVRYASSLLQFLTDPPLFVPVLLAAAIVAANRAWFFLDFPIVAIHPDSGSYFGVAEQIGSGVWPNFANRPPVYPLFLHAVFAVANRAIALAACQTLLSLFGGVALVYAVYRRSATLSLPAALGVGAFLCNSIVVEHDTAMLSESVYTSFLMLSFAGLLIGINGRGSGRWLAVASACMALAILTRPAGMFLLGSYAIAALWLIWNRFRFAAVAAFLMPMPVLLLLMSAYNAFVVRAFVPSTWAEANLAVATFLYWETAPSYPPEINDDIRKIQRIIDHRFAVTGKDRTPLQTSWAPDVLSPLFVESFNAAALDIAQQMGGNYETVGREWIRRIAFNSIRQHPTIYAKFVYSMLFNYFRPVPDIEFRAYLQNRARTFYVDRHFSATTGNMFMVRMGKELADATPPPSVVVTNLDPAAHLDLSDRIILAPTRAWRVYELTHRVRQDVFESWVWTFAILAGLLASSIVLFRKHARDVDAFSVFIVTISAVGASLVVSLVEYSQPRYSCPMEWTYNLSMVLLPLVLVQLGARRHVDSPAAASVVD